MSFLSAGRLEVELPWVRKVLPQRWHWYGFSPVCVRRCMFRLTFWVKAWLQISHTNGRSFLQTNREKKKCRVQIDSKNKRDQSLLFNERRQMNRCGCVQHANKVEKAYGVYDMMRIHAVYIQFYTQTPKSPSRMFFILATGQLIWIVSCSTHWDVITMATSRRTAYCWLYSTSTADVHNVIKSPYLI